MALDTYRLSRLRPYLYHLTARQNLPAIVRCRELYCARFLLDAAGVGHLATTRRIDHLPIAFEGGRLHIRDQKPLAAGAIAFEVGWTLERFVDHINEHVFFWPGTSAGPIPAGKNHFARYNKENPVVIRFGTDDAAQSALFYSRYNSGAPRCSGGKYSPRGSSTYLPAARFQGSPSDVIEVVARGPVALPLESEVADDPSGPWRKLFSD